MVIGRRREMLNRYLREGMREEGRERDTRRKGMVIKRGVVIERGMVIG